MSASNVTPIRPGAQKQKKPKKAVDWALGLERQGKGFAGHERNILIALRAAPELAGLVRLNEFALTIELARSPPWRESSAGDAWREEDDTLLAAWLQDQGLKVRSGAVAACVAVVALEHPYHPVREYLLGLTWDGTKRLDTWLTIYLSAASDRSDNAAGYLAAIGTKFLISAVARILKPGCQADHMLVLESIQGAGKTNLVRTLGVKPEWVAGDLPDMHNKDARIQLVGRWLVEIAELKAIRTSELEVQKSFITQTVDTFRAPYGRRTGQFKRQCVFIATTNENQYLRDRTGNRRFWPAHCGAVDFSALERDRDQLWAEAVAEFKAGTIWYLTPNENALASIEQHERVYISELEQDVDRYLDEHCNGRNEVTVEELLTGALRLDRNHQAYTAEARRLGPSVAEALECAGWKKGPRVGRSKRTLYFRTPPLATGPKPPPAAKKKASKF